MANYSIGDLIHDSFRVTHGMIVVFPQTGHEVTLSVDFTLNKPFIILHLIQMKDIICYTFLTLNLNLTLLML